MDHQESIGQNNNRIGLRNYEGDGKPLTASTGNIANLIKITMPKSARILPRPRLFKLLDDFADRPITWITGPVGSGKTSLVANDMLHLHTRWYQVAPLKGANNYE